jgi:allophanate hydrolase
MTDDTRSPVAAAQQALAADAAHADPAIWITRLPDAAVLDAARKLEAEGKRGRPLWGVPFAVKDNIDVAGLPTTAACPDFAYTPSSSAPVVQRLLDAGALLLGKTNLDQFATGLTGVRTPYGTPRNVFDAALVPGGSSSGSACAVAAGIVPFALGTDTAGSGRVPAMFGGIVGLKPTIGSLSATGVVPACRSIDTISIFARSVDEALAVARIAAWFDDADPYSRAAPALHLRRGAQGAVRLGIAAGMPPCDKAVEAAYREAADLFETVSVDLAPFLEIARLLYEGPWVAERTAALRHFADAHPASLLPTTSAILQTGYDRSAIDAFDAFHHLARARRAAQRLFRDVDALLVPTAPFCPTLEACAADPIAPNSRLGTFTNFVNLCDLVAIAVPAGEGAIGVTVLGPAWSEGRIAAIADRIHRAFRQTVGATVHAIPQAAALDPLGPEETELFCIGAHMSGLPLNHQLRDRGGRLLRVARTEPRYRLYALGERPGLVRAAGGTAIEGEVWALPSARIGDLLALVPPPLGFGTVFLADGPCLGFLAEAEALDGARDITDHRGWRAWLAAREGVAA